METVIKTQGLTKYYGDTAALNELNLEVKRGEVLGYLGPNGAGKTTTIRLLLGLLKPTSGRATIFGFDTATDKIEAHRHIAFVPGDAELWPSLTGEETLHLLASIHGSVDETYRDELIKRFKFQPNKKVRTYSKGNKQKINLIAAFASRAGLLILDEPTSGLDPLMEQAFHQCVREAKANGQTIFLSSHILSEVEQLCDRVAVLQEGKLIELGTLESMRHLSAVTLEATFEGKPPKVDHIEGVSNVEITKHHLSCQVRGPIGKLITEIAKGDPITLFSREPSLEELFLALYGSKNGKK